MCPSPVELHHHPLLRALKLEVGYNQFSSLEVSCREGPGWAKVIPVCVFGGYGVVVDLNRAPTIVLATRSRSKVRKVVDESNQLLDLVGHWPDVSFVAAVGDPNTGSSARDLSSR